MEMRMGNMSMSMGDMTMSFDDMSAPKKKDQKKNSASSFASSSSSSSSSSSGGIGISTQSSNGQDTVVITCPDPKNLAIIVNGKPAKLNFK